MGEYADYNIDQMMDAFPEWGSPFSGNRSKTVHCSYCGTTKVHWGYFGKKEYALLNADGSRHKCPEFYAYKKKMYGDRVQTATELFKIVKRIDK